MSKMTDYALTIEELSQTTGLPMAQICAEIDAQENELADITITTGVPYTYVCRLFVLNGFSASTVNEIIRYGKRREAAKT